MAISYSFCESISNASTPSLALSTSNPARSATRVRSFRMVRSSSTTRRGVFRSFFFTTPYVIARSVLVSANRKLLEQQYFETISANRLQQSAVPRIFGTPLPVSTAELAKALAQGVEDDRVGFSAFPKLRTADG